MVAANSLNITETGFQSFDGVSVFKGRTLTAGSNISITNGTGVSGNPTISATGLLTSVATSNATPQFSLAGTVETIDFNLSNLLLGVPGTFITSGMQNCGYGQLCLPALTSGTLNSAYGYGAGNSISVGQGNSLFGTGAGASITISNFTTAMGVSALGNFTTTPGDIASNSAYGYFCFKNVLTGHHLIGMGVSAGINYVGAESSNIIIGNSGTVGESNVIRIGTQGSGSAQQNICLIAGIVGVTNSNPVLTTINSSTGQLGVQALTQYSLLSGGASNALNQIATTATVGQVLQSAGAASQPTYSTAAYPLTAGTSGNVIVSNGTNFTSTTPPVSSKITTYLASSTWTIDPRSLTVEFLVWGGGGGGGSGRDGATNSGGGAGGAPGSFVHIKTQASFLTGSPYTVTVGTGGGGGASVNATTTDGNPGNPGTASSIGTAIISSGGTGGGGGIAGTATGGTSSAYLMYSALTAASGGNGSTTGVAASNIVYGWATGGGGAAGFVTATPRTGKAGGSITDPAGNVLVAGGLAGDNAGNLAGNGNAPGSQPTWVGGTGGGGGGCNGTATAGTGGNGAIPGGGGGGGAANLSLNASGAGGNGANGKIIIIEYF